MANPLFVRLGLQAEEFIKGMTDARNKLKEIDKNTKQLNNTFGTLKKVAVMAFAGWGMYRVIGEVKSLIKESVLLASRYTTLGVVIYQVGKTAGYTRAQMDSFAKGLEKTGISVIESRQTLARMVQAQIDLTKATELGRIAQDAAVIGQMNSSEAFSNMIYGIQSANVRVLRTIGINVLWEKGYKKLADQLGKTTEELTEYERSQARTNEVLEYGVRIQGTYEAAMTTASKQLKSMERYVEDFRVELGKAFEPAFTQLIFAATKEIKELSRIIQDPGFQEGVATLAGGFAKLASFLMQAGTTAAAFWIKMLSPPISIEALKTHIKEIETEIRQFQARIENAATLVGPRSAKAYAEDARKQIKILQKELENQRQRLILEQKGVFAAKPIFSPFETGGGFFEEGAGGGPLEQTVTWTKKELEGINKARERAFEEAEELAKEYAMFRTKLNQETNQKIFDNDAKLALARERAAEDELTLKKEYADFWLEYARKNGEEEVEIAQRIRDNDEQLTKDLDNYIVNQGQAELQRRQAWAEEKMKVAKKENQEMIDLSKRTAWAMQENFSNLFFDAMTGQFKDLGDYARATFRSIQRAFADYLGQMVTQSLFGKQGKEGGSGGLLSKVFGLIGGAFGGSGGGSAGAWSTAIGSGTWGDAKGAIYNRGVRSAFAKGGVVTGPTIFPMANGMGLMGESGPEAIMPLKRTSSGELGIKTEGERGNIFNITINAVDAKSFSELTSRNPQAIVTPFLRALRQGGVVRDALKGAM